MQIAQDRAIRRQLSTLPALLLLVLWVSAGPPPLPPPPREGVSLISRKSDLLLMSSGARICKPFKEPRNRFPAWRAGRYNNPICRTADLPGNIGWRNRFLGIEESIP
jgi:hypothetical protein